MLASRGFWESALVGAAIFAGLACCPFAEHVIRAAPVPPAPKELPAEVLPGKWHYRWGGHANGTMWLFADHTYSAVHGPDYPCVCTGTWRVEGWALVLTETVYYPATGSLSGPQVYRVECDPKSLPNVCGRWHSVPVELTDPRRE